ncbi:SAM-dependent methyltransferase [Actinomadura bangladeshensis]|nr:SAM-dependent methyltransferase [Actinomadura bangladeshensis]
MPHTARVWNYRPGVVSCSRWRPGVTAPERLPKPVYRYGGLARKR